MLFSAGARGQSLNLYATSYYGGTITEFPASGGSAIDFASGLSDPQYLALDSAGNIYQPDQGSGNVYVYSPTRVRSTLASGISEAFGVALDSSGNVFVSTTTGDGDSIVKISGDGTHTNFATGLGDPNGLAFNSAGDLFEADYSTGEINEFTPAGVETNFVSGLSHPLGLAFDSSGNLYVTDNGSGELLKFAPDGAKTVVGTGITGADGIAIDSANEVFVASFSQFAGKIFEYSPTGVQTLFTNLNGVAGLAIQPVYQPSSPAVPEPSTWVMLGMGALGLVRLRRKK